MRHAIRKIRSFFLYLYLLSSALWGMYSHSLQADFCLLMLLMFAKKKKKKVNQFMSYSQEPRALWHNDIMLNSIKVKQYTADLALVSESSLTEEVTRLWKKNTPVKWEAASGSLPITLRMCQDWSVFCLSVIWVVLHITGLNGFKLMGLNFSDIFWKGFYI